MVERRKGSVLITGASTGIGKACALLLDRSGYRVFAGIRKEKDGQRLQTEGTGNIFPITLDITDADQIAKAVETVTDALEPGSGLAGLVNNAGIVMAGPLEFLPIDSLRRQLEVNVIGHVAVIQAFLPLIQKGCGRIVNIGSTAAFFAAPFLGAYAASKFAMEAVADSLRRELLPRGIFVSVVEPGYTETPIWDKGYDQADQLMEGFAAHAKDLYVNPFNRGRKFLDKGRHQAISPEVIAKAVSRAIGSKRPKTRYLVGTDTHVLALAAKFLPDRLGDWLTRKFLGT